MPEITDSPPEEIAKELADLRSELDQAIPPKLLDRNLLIATWNIRRLDKVVEKWVSGREGRHGRDLHALRCIAEILSHFDVVALQEAIGDAQALGYILEYLGAHWGLLLTDPSSGRLGNNERLGFLYDTRKVIPTGMVCELVLPQDRLERGGPDTLNRQFARTPYVAGFRSLDKTFTLVNLHVFYGGKGPLERVKELKEIALWLARWAKKGSTWDRNLIAVGDYNIEHYEDPLFQAFTSTGLYVPEDLRATQRIIFHDPQRPAKLYDQIAWFNGEGGMPALALNYQRAGNFDFTRTVMKSRNLTKRELSYLISDHLPLWVEFLVRD